MSYRRYRVVMCQAIALVFVVGGVLAVPPTENGLIVQVLKSVEKTLDFFVDDYSAINVDGLFGLRLGQGQLREAVRECRERSCDSHMVTMLRELESKLNTASDAALPYLEEDDPAYFTRFRATIDQPYVMPYEPSSFRGMDTKIGSNSSYIEEKGDVCYARMIGTYEENGSKVPRCNITEECWEYMTLPDTRAYFITHQLLYFIFVEHVGCREEVESFTNGHKLRDVLTSLCSMIYEESRELSEKGDVSFFRKDLFLEQTVLCGPLGFEDFMREDWINMVLGWPDPNLGCFTRLGPGDNPLAALLGQQRRRQESPYESVNTNTMRKILREKQMKDGCLSHTSGLGFGVLCSYLRYLIRFLYEPI